MGIARGPSSEHQRQPGRTERVRGPGIVLMALSAACSGPAALSAAAAEPPTKPDGSTLVRARLVSETASLTPGSTAFLGATFDIEPGWHLYSNYANDSGAPINIELTLPPGFTAGEILWPSPKRYVQPGDLVDYVYEGRVTLLVPVTVPTDATGTAECTAAIDWLVCKDVCLAGRGTSTLRIPVTPATPAGAPGKPATERPAATPSRPSPDAPLFHEARALLPREWAPQPAGGSTQLAVRLEGNSLHIRAPGASRVEFFPMPEGWLPVDAARDGAADGDTLTIPLAGGPGEQARVTGTLMIQRSGAGPREHLRVRVPPGEEAWKSK